MSNLPNKSVQSLRDSRWYKSIMMIVKLAIAVGIIYILIRQADIKVENFQNLHLGWIAAAFAALLVQGVITGIRWRELLRGAGVKVSWIKAVSLTMQGLFFTLFIPGGTVSGDVIKATLVAKDTDSGSKFIAVFSILIDRVCGLCGLLMLSGGAALYAYCSGNEYSALLNQTLISIMIIAPAGLLAAWCAFRSDLILKIKLFRKLFDFANRITHGAVGRIEEALASFRSAAKTVWIWTFISGLVAFPIVALSVWFIAIGVMGSENCGASAIASLLAGSIGELSGILPLTPGGIGVRDVVFMEIFKGCGFDEKAATLVPVIFTTLFILVNSLGGLFLIYDVVFGKGRGSKK